MVGHAAGHVLAAERLRLGYGDRPVIAELSLKVPPQKITSIVGPNGCGKSTLLKGLARLLAPRAGAVLLDGAAIRTLPTREVARVVGLLPQAPAIPDRITVTELVSHGRFPHRQRFSRWSATDEAAVVDAMRATGVLELADSEVDRLSGGQRQRAWIAMALAQGTSVLLLDEPTTHLDVSHQIEILDVLVDLNLEGRTIVMVLHDLNLAARYSDHLFALRDGALVAEGSPEDLIQPSFVRQLFGIDCRVLADPMSGRPIVVPCGRHGLRKPRRAPVG